MFDFGNQVSIKIQRRREFVFLVLSGIFLGSLTMLNILGLTKILEFNIFGIPAKIAVGVLPYPITFLCTDFISEIYGQRRANNVVLVGLVLNLWVLFILWLGSVLPPETTQEAFYSNGKLIIPEGINGAANATGEPKHGWVFYEIKMLTFGATAASMIAYLAAQFVDVHIFHFLKKLTKGKHLWLRNNGSTLVSQLVDSVAVTLIAHYYANAYRVQGSEQEFSFIINVILSTYLFKFLAALIDTLPFYYGTKLLSKYLEIDPNKGYAADE